MPQIADRTRTLLHQFLMFAGVGALGTAAHYLVLIALVEFAGTRAVIATACGFVVGAIFVYVLNRRFTFDSQRSHLEAVPRFVTVAVLGGLLNVAVVYAGTELLHVNYLFSQVVATGIVLVLNFVAHRLWTFAAATGGNR